MFLKIVAFFYAFCFSVSLFDPTFYETPLRVVGLALGLGALTGLFAVAFKKPFLSEGFWRLFSVIYVGYQLVCLLLGGAQTVIASHGISGLIGALAIGVVFQFPIYLSLWRLSFATAHSGRRRLDEAPARQSDA
jgi:hypothetical protein